jgi:hypothetical protein
MTRRFAIKLFVSIYAITQFNLFFDKSIFLLKKNLIKKEKNLHWIINESDL